MKDGQMRELKQFIRTEVGDLKQYMDARFTGLDGRVDTLEIEVKGLKHELEGLKQETKKLKKETKKLGVDMQSGFTTIAESLTMHSDELESDDKRLKRLETRTV